MKIKKDVFAINWMEVDALVKARHDDPHHILGMHECIDDIYVNVFQPTAKQITVINEKTKEEYALEAKRVSGFFSVKIPKCKRFDYSIRMTKEDGTEYTYIDPYMFESVIDSIDISLFNEGMHYEIYEKLGAHPMTVDGVAGVLFAVWAPNAERVSVVADFNHWDGRIHQMRRLPYSGIFELFIPGVGENEIYKYEVRSRNGELKMKSDPYGNASELRPCNASIVTDLRKYEWKDDAWMQNRDKVEASKAPMSIYEVYLGAWKRPTDGREYYNYRELAVKLAEYMKDMGYTHIELMPVMEHPYDPSWGYQVTGYYAPTARYGSPEDFMYFVDYMHEQGISVIIDWVPAHFPKDENGLGRFDGSCVYEHEDPRRGEHPHWGTYIFDYSKPEVKNFLIANALFWADKYHVDGIRMDAVASMLYLDYGRDFGNWLPNMYGGNENLDAIDMLKQLNTVMKERYPSCIMIAEESTAWPMVSHPVADGGLGFDFKWNMGWMNDFLEYMKLDPYFRSFNHNRLTFSLMYTYSENFILVISHDEVVHLKCSMLLKMPGTMPEKFANLKTAYGFMYAHPGKKLLFMGQEFGQEREWSEARSLDWYILDQPGHQGLQKFVKKLNALYKKYDAFYYNDCDQMGFEWINCNDNEHSQISFIRRGSTARDQLLFICNFTPVEREKFWVGVPCLGSYTEILNSDAEEFEGEGRVNKKPLQAIPGSCDGKEQYISFTLPPLSVVVFKYDYVDNKVYLEKQAEEKAAKKAKAAEKKVPAKKKVVDKKAAADKAKPAGSKEKK